MPKGMARVVTGLAPTGCCGRHHPANRHHPGDREINLAEQDDQHETGGDDAQERGNLQLLQQIIGGKKIRRIERSDKEKGDNTAERRKDDWINPSEYARFASCLSFPYRYRVYS